MASHSGCGQDVSLICPVSVLACCVVCIKGLFVYLCRFNPLLPGTFSMGSESMMLVDYRLGKVENEIRM